MQNRTDNISHCWEEFEYDDLNRLTTWTPWNKLSGETHSITYNKATSNIETKSDIGGFIMNYGEPFNSSVSEVNQNPGPHALTSISGIPQNFPTVDLSVKYTDFQKIKTLSEGTKGYSITYGVDDQRRKSVYTENGAVKLTRYYIGDYEEETDNAGNIKKIHYLSGGAILITNNNVETLYYGYSDYLGSLVALTDANGNVVEKYAYDPWGARRNPTDWTKTDNRTTWIVNRGYTGHEHLDAFGIINMNGRVYDPQTSQFLSPDPHVQAPDNWLNYNRYGYALGNPLKYTDPSGELFFYVIPSVSYSYSSGLQVSVSAGIGFPGGASAGITGSYNFKYGNWSITANGSFSGSYVYAGYDSKAGFIAGAGYGFGGPMWNAIGSSSSALSAGVGYSAEGGFSANTFGLNYSSSGVKFDPNIGLSYNLNWYNYTYFEDFEHGESTSAGNFNYSDEDIQNMMANEGVYFKDFGLTDVSAWKKFDGIVNYEGQRCLVYRGDDGIFYRVPLTGGESTGIKGFTKMVGNPWKKQTEIYMSRMTDDAQFVKTLNHELIHAYHHHIGLHLSLGDKFNQYTEYVAYKYSVSVGSQPLSSLNRWGGIPYVEIMPPVLLSIPK